MSVLVQRSVTRTLVSMAVPMLAGTFAMNAYNLTDTWFVAQLGTLPLTAMGFTFPVVMLLTCVARGLGSGVTALVSHAIGRHDHAAAAKLVTHGLLMTLAVTLAWSAVGYALIEATFTSLGADETTLPLVADYMRIWYLGAACMTLPMVGCGVLISAGDSRSASLIMVLGTLANLVLDPIMIFGLLGCPAMGIRGAAWATVLAQGVSTLWLLKLLWRDHRLLAWTGSLWAGFLGSLQRVTVFAVPSILSMILMPISAAVVTRLLADCGNAAVAASGVAGRLEAFAFMIPMALGISLTPFMSQNFGAGRMDRVREAHRTSTLFALGYGALTTLVFYLGAPTLASIFSDDPAVVGTLVLYVRTVSFGYGVMETHRYCSFVLTGMQRPVAAGLLNAIRVLVLLIPLSYLGAHLAGVQGVFLGRLATDLVAGVIGLAWVARALGSAPAAVLEEAHERA